MTYRGTLGLGSYTWADHSRNRQKIAAVLVEYNNVFNPIAYHLRVFDDQQLSMVWTRRLPDTPYNNMTYTSAGRFVAFRSDGSKLYVIATAGPGAGLVNALYTFEP